MDKKLRNRYRKAIGIQPNIIKVACLSDLLEPSNFIDKKNKSLCCMKTEINKEIKSETESSNSQYNKEYR